MLRRADGFVGLITGHGSRMKRDLWHQHGAALGRLWHSTAAAGCVACLERVSDYLACAALVRAAAERLAKRFGRPKGWLGCGAQGLDGRRLDRSVGRRVSQLSGQSAVRLSCLAALRATHGLPTVAAERATPSPCKAGFLCENELLRQGRLKGNKHLEREFLKE